MKFEKNKSLMSGSGEWDESEHPRDSEGKFTKKGLSSLTGSKDENEVSDLKQTITNAKVSGSKESKIIEKLDIQNKKELNSYIDKCCSVLADEEIEHSIIIDKDGNVWHTLGDGKFVLPSEEIDRKGSTIIHNHADYPHSFSRDDCINIFDNLNVQYVLADKEYVYRLIALKRPDKVWNYYYNQGLDDAIMAGCDYQEKEHYAMLLMQKEGVICYERNKRQDN